MERTSIKVTEFYLDITYDMGNANETYRTYYDTFDQMCVEYCRCHAFSDCCPDIVNMFASAGGRRVRYRGWEPGMVYVLYFEDTCEDCFRGQFLAWEH